MSVAAINPDATKTIRVLIVEDSKSDLTIIEDMLGQIHDANIEIEHAESLSKGLDFARENEFDIVILDLGLPDSAGLDTFTIFRTEVPDLPVVILTGNSDDVGALRAVQDGAQDYLRKNELYPNLLARSIFHGIERYRFSAELQRRAEKLARGEARTRAIIDASLDAIIIIDNNREIQFSNPAARAMGIDSKPDLLIKSPIFELEPGSVAELYIRFNGAGSQRIVELRAVEILWNDSPARMVTLRDITEQKRQLEKLQDQAKLLDGASDGIIVRDPEWKIVYWNVGASRIFGYSTQEATGADLHLYPEEKSNDVNMNIARRSVLERGEWSGEIAGIDRAQRQLVLSCRMTLLRGPSGDPRGVLEIVTNVTDKKQLELQVLRSQRLESLGVLAGGIAHDFNNILSVIVGNVSLALHDLPPDSKIYQYLTVVSEAGDRASDLVKRILTFSRPREIPTGIVQLDSVVPEVVKLLRAALPAMIEIKTAVSSGLPPVRADATQIHQMIMNLGTNAAHAIGDRPGNIHISAELVQLDPEVAKYHDNLKEGAYVRLSVRDDGCGMDTKTLEHVFEPFFTTKDPGKGTGLGLSVVHGIIKSVGGSISVYSEPGRGTQFHIFLQIAGDVKPQREREAGAPAVPPANGERVIFVDDEAAIVHLCGPMLERYGYRVFCYDDPERALKDFRQRPADFDIVITDASMPKMSGLDLAAEILRIRPDVPVILASGYLRDRDLAAANRLGVAHVVTKPFTGRMIHQIISMLLRAKGKTK